MESITPYIGESGERLALHVLNYERFNGAKLTPEHVETRSLHNPMEPNMNQVRALLLFIFVFFIYVLGPTISYY